MVPTEYIKCESYNCICNSNCFKLNGSVCDYSVCGQYDNITSTCTDSPDLKDQKTAFLLSMFLSSVGAANFYIERYDLGRQGGNVQYTLLFLILCLHIHIINETQGHFAVFLCYLLHCFVFIVIKIMIYAQFLE